MKKYWLSPTLKWSVFKKLQTALYKGKTGITPSQADRMIWEMLRDRQLNIFVADDKDDSVFPTLKKIPKGAVIISNPKK